MFAPVTLNLNRIGQSTPFSGKCASLLNGEANLPPLAGPAGVRKWDNRLNLNAQFRALGQGCGRKIADLAELLPGRQWRFAACSAKQAALRSMVVAAPFAGDFVHEA